MVLERRDPTQTVTSQRIQAEADQRTAAGLLRELSDEATTLIRQEIDLAKLEISEKISRMTRDIIWIVAGGAIAYAGLLALVQAAINGLGIGLWTATPLYIAAWLAPLIIAVVVLVIGYIMIQRAVSSLKKQKIVPEKTVETMRENKQWLEKQIR